MGYRVVRDVADRRRVASIVISRKSIAADTVGLPVVNTPTITEELVA